MVIQSFADVGSEDVYNGRNTRAARGVCPRQLLSVAARKLDQLDSEERLEELRIPPGNRLEALSGKREGQFSIRLNDQYRLCFRWSASGPANVRIEDYH